MTPEAQSKAARQRNELRAQAETIARLRREKMELTRDLRAAEAAMVDRIEALETTLTLIKEAYEWRAKLFTSDADCAANMYDRACAALGETSDD